MTRTVTAFFDNRAEAEAARARLTQSDVDVGRVQIIDKTHTDASGSTGTTNSGGASDGEGFWASLKSAFLPEEDSHAYEEGLRRGGFLVCAQVYENEAEQAIRILEESDSVDFDQRQEQWRGEGWSGFTGSAPQTAGSLGGRSTGSLGATSSGTAAGTAAADSSGMAAGQPSETLEEQHIPIVEEELRVGKREVSRGGARVRSYIREIPVHEQVTLREEHVSVERRPVDQKIAAADLNSGDLLRDRTIEMTEKAEEAVVAKEARVREELVVKKTAEQHVEQIDDTVRRTELDVDEGMRGSEDRSAFGFKEGGKGTPGSTGTSGGGTGATGLDSKREPERQGSGYTDRIDKTGL
jgi:uncharacterized protein (TIGR02271 family)